MAVTPDQFRVDFPAFASTVKYPDGMIMLWATVADSLLDASRWGDLFLLGEELFIAHNIILDGMMMQDASRGGLVGFAKGPVSGESGDKVSITYAVASSMEEGAGHWNLTFFGQRYWQLMRMAGASAVQVGPSPFGGILPHMGWGRGGPSNMQF